MVAQGPCETGRILERIPVPGRRLCSETLQPSSGIRPRVFLAICQGKNVPFISEHTDLFNFLLQGSECSHERIALTYKGKNRVGGVLTEALWLRSSRETLLCEVAVRGGKKPASPEPRGEGERCSWVSVSATSPWPRTGELGFLKRG